jgi:hypothetical protein
VARAQQASGIRPNKACEPKGEQPGNVWTCAQVPLLAWGQGALTTRDEVAGRVLVALSRVVAREANGVVDRAGLDLSHLDQARVDGQPRRVGAGPAQRALRQHRVAQVEGSAIGTRPGRCARRWGKR